MELTKWALPLPPRPPSAVHALAVFDDVDEDFIRMGVLDDRTDRDADLDILAVSASLIRARAVMPAGPGSRAGVTAS